MSESKNIYTILFAEDERSHHSLFDYVADKAGKKANCEVHVIHARDGHEAMQLYNASKDGAQTLDLIVTDNEMPVKTGKQFIAELREKDKEVPIAMLSTRPPSDMPGEWNVRVESFKAGDFAQLEKLLTGYISQKYGNSQH